MKQIINLIFIHKTKFSNLFFYWTRDFVNYNVSDRYFIAATLNTISGSFSADASANIFKSEIALDKMVNMNKESYELTFSQPEKKKSRRFYGLAWSA